MSRTTARSAAMQMIYERFAGGNGGEDTLQMIYDQLKEDENPPVKVFDDEPGEDDRGFILRAIEGVIANRERIDEVISGTAKGWTLERMSNIDLNILRLAVWEILYEPDVPDNVAVSEAVALTERYSDPDDKPFINGILGTIVRKKDAEA